MKTFTLLAITLFSLNAHAATGLNLECYGRGYVKVPANSPRGEFASIFKIKISEAKNTIEIFLRNSNSSHQEYQLAKTIHGFKIEPGQSAQNPISVMSHVEDSKMKLYFSGEFLSAHLGSGVFKIEENDLTIGNRNDSDDHLICHSDKNIVRWANDFYHST